MAIVHLRHDAATSPVPTGIGVVADPQLTLTEGKWVMDPSKPAGYTGIRDGRKLTVPASAILYVEEVEEESV